MAQVYLTLFLYFFLLKIFVSDNYYTIKQTAVVNKYATVLFSDEK